MILPKVVGICHLHNRVKKIDVKCSLKPMLLLLSNEFPQVLRRGHNEIMTEGLHYYKFCSSLLQQCSKFLFDFYIQKTVYNIYYLYT